MGAERRLLAVRSRHRLLVLTFVVPALSYRCVEQPFLRMKDRRPAPSGTKRENDSVAV